MPVVPEGVRVVLAGEVGGVAIVALDVPIAGVTEPVTVPVLLELVGFVGLVILLVLSETLLVAVETVLTEVLGPAVLGLATGVEATADVVLSSVTGVLEGTTVMLGEPVLVVFTVVVDAPAAVLELVFGAVALVALGVAVVLIFAEDAVEPTADELLSPVLLLLEVKLGAEAAVTVVSPEVPLSLSDSVPLSVVPGVT